MADVHGFQVGPVQSASDSVYLLTRGPASFIFGGPYDSKAKREHYFGCKPFSSAEICWNPLIKLCHILNSEIQPGIPYTHRITTVTSHKKLGNIIAKLLH